MGKRFCWPQVMFWKLEYKRINMILAWTKGLTRLDQIKLDRNLVTCTQSIIPHMCMLTIANGIKHKVQLRQESVLFCRYLRTNRSVGYSTDVLMVENLRGAWMSEPLVLEIFHTTLFDDPMTFTLLPTKSSTFFSGNHECLNINAQNSGANLSGRCCCWCYMVSHEAS